MGGELSTRLGVLSLGLRAEATTSITGPRPTAEYSYLRVGWMLGLNLDLGPSTVIAPSLGMSYSNLNGDNSGTLIRSAASGRIGIDVDQFVSREFSLGAGLGLDLRFPGNSVLVDAWAVSAVARVGVRAPILRADGKLDPGTAPVISGLATAGGVIAGIALATSASSEGGAPGAGVTLAALSLLAAPSLGRGLGGDGRGAAGRIGMRFLVFGLGGGASAFLLRLGAQGGGGMSILGDVVGISTVAAILVLGIRDISSTADDLRERSAVIGQLTDADQSNHSGH
jgi:hypothetical protein